MLVRHKTLRAGQALFNALLLVRPDLAEEIRGTDLDPFYDNKKIKKCLEWLNPKLT